MRQALLHDSYRKIDFVAPYPSLIQLYLFSKRYKTETPHTKYFLNRDNYCPLSEKKGITLYRWGCL